MNRKEAIDIIKQLYPADSQNPATAAVGQQLLETAKREVLGWWNEPTEVLVRYAELCEEVERGEVWAKKT